MMILRQLSIIGACVAICGCSKSQVDFSSGPGEDEIIPVTNLPSVVAEAMARDFPTAKVRQAACSKAAEGIYTVSLELPSGETTEAAYFPDGSKTKTVSQPTSGGNSSPHVDADHPTQDM
jgi:hypothetical protein